MSLLAALVGAIVSIRQVLLHILPGDPGYGSAIAGLHYYSWAAVIFTLAIALIGVILMFERQFDDAATPWWPPTFAIVAVWPIIVLAAANGVSTLLECGITWCPDNPVRYEMLTRIR
jgi:hypothetical protein